MTGKKYAYPLIGCLLGTAFAISLYLSLSGRIADGRQRDGIRVMLIGLDGLSWKVMTPLMKRGELPNIRRLVESGVSGVNHPIGEVSPIIWTDVATGKVPAKHGIDGFLYRDRDMSQVRVGSTDRKVKAIWNILSGRGATVGVVNWLVSWPAERVRGFMVADDIGGKDRRGRGVYPADLEMPRVDAPHALEGIDDPEESVLKNDLNRLHADLRTASALFAARRPDFCAVYTSVTDDVQHLYWKYREPRLFPEKVWGLTPERLARFSGTVEDVYRRADRYVGELLGLCGRDTVVILLSDHGFQALRNKGRLIYTFDVERLLEIGGFVREGVHHRDAKISDRWDLLVFDGKGSSSQRGDLEERLDRFFRTVRFVSDGAPVFEGTFRRGKFPKLAGEYDLVVAERDRDIFDRIATGERLLVNGRAWPLDGFVQCRGFSGVHDMEDGVFVMAGGPVRRNARVEGVRSVDVTPTILYLMGLPVGRDMDGQVVSGAFTPVYRLFHPVRYVPSYEGDADRPEEAARPADGGDRPDESYLRRLKTLGYIQ